MPRALGFAVAALLALSTVALAGSPVTGEIKVNTSPVDGQTHPDVAMDALGKFAVVWRSSEDDIDGRVFDVSGTPLTPEIDGDPGDHPAVSTDAAGTRVVVVHEESGDIHATVISLSGPQSLGTVNTTAGSAARADVAMSPSGAFVVVWELDGTVHGRLYNAAGEPVNADFPITSGGADPSVAIHDSGAFAVVWEANDGNGRGIEARTFGSTGLPLTDLPIAVPAGPAGDQHNPQVATDANGAGFTAVWQVGSGSDMDILGRRFTTAGAPATGEFPLSQTTDGFQGSPQVAMSDAGNVIITAWEGNGVADDVGIFYRRFNAAGLPTGAETAAAAQSPGTAFEPSLATNASGDLFVITWVGDVNGASNEVIARRFNLAAGGGTDTGDIAKLGKISANGRRVVVPVTCVASSCTFKGSARLTVPNRALKKKRARRSKAFRLKQASTRLSAGETGKLTIKLSKKARRAAKKAFKKKKFRKKLRAKLDLEVVNQLGRVQDLGTPKVKVKPPKLKKTRRGKAPAKRR